MILKKYIIAVPFLIFLITGCTTSPAIIVKAGDRDQIVTAKAGKTFSIQLEAQLSTGYSWKLAEVPVSLKIIEENVLTDKSDTDKTGGYETQEFVFRSKEKGEVTLTFRYGRHWKGKPDYAKISVVKVKVE